MNIMKWIAGAAVLGLIVVVGAAYWSFDHRINGEIAEVLKVQPVPRRIVTEAMLAPLPEPAQRYLRYAGVVGKPIPSTVVVHQNGRIRTSEKWLELEAVEYYATTPPRFLWKAWMPRRTQPVAFGRDTYRDGQASILIKMGALWPLADERGAELGDAGLMRYLSEAIWFPAAFLRDNITWKAVDGNSVDVTIRDSGHSVTARLFIDSEGRLTNLMARRLDTTTRSIERWETPVTAYGTFNGLRLPVRGAALFQRKSGAFKYIEIKVTAIEYDPA